MKKYPVSAAGFLIMLMAVFAGFQPSTASMFMLFATTLFGGWMIKKHAGKETYDGFVIIFGYLAAIFNFIAAGMIMLTPLDYVDKASSAFLSMLVGFVILTLIRNNRDEQSKER